MNKVLYSYESFRDKKSTCNCTLCFGYSTPMHFHNCIELLYIKEGALECNVGGNIFIAEKDDIVFVDSRSLHSFSGVKDTDYKYYCVVIGESFATDFDHRFKTSSLPNFLSNKNNNRSIRLFFEHLKFYREKDDLIQKGLINVIIGKLLEYYPTITKQNQAKHVDVLIDILDYINAHYSEPITLDSISKEFGYNKYYFSRLFNTYVGDNLNEYLNMIRLRKVIAKYEKGGVLTNIVYDSGFNSMTSFYRAFSKFYNQTPSNYFKQKKQK